MPILDLTAYKPAAGGALDAIQIDNGFQAIVNTINALDSANFAAGRIFDPAKLMQDGALDGDGLVWDNVNTKWVPASAMPAGRPRAPRMIVSTLAGGPPASPVDQDIWIATAVNAMGTRQAFQYNAGSASPSKWEFIGGGPMWISGDPNVVINTKTQVAASGFYYDPATMSLTLARSGDYSFETRTAFDANGAAGTLIQAAVFAGAVLLGQAVPDTLGSANFATLNTLDEASITAGQTVGVAVASSNAAANKMRQSFFRVHPIRIS